MRSEQHHLGILRTIIFTTTIDRTSERCTSALFTLNSIGSRFGCLMCLHPLTHTVLKLDPLKDGSLYAGGCTGKFSVLSRISLHVIFIPYLHDWKHYNNVSRPPFACVAVGGSCLPITIWWKFCLPFRGIISSCLILIGSLAMNSSMVLLSIMNFLSNDQSA